MSDHQTLRKMIMEELDRPNDSTYVDRAIVEALRYHRADHFWFNEGYFELVTTQGQWAYDLPADFIRQIGHVYFTRASSPTDRKVLRNKTSDYVEQARYLGTDPDHWGTWESGMSSGTPSCYALYDGQLVLSPMADTTGDKINGRYVRDLGIPTVLYDGSNWQLYLPNTSSTTLPATYTNDWYKDGQDLIRTRTNYILYTRYYKNPDAAQSAAMENAEALVRMRTEFTRRRSPRTIRPSF